VADSVYDVIIVGGGPAGLAAALYTARDRYSTVVIEKNFEPGGQIWITDRIENYPGFERVSGPDLVAKMKGQCESFGAEFLTRHEAQKLTQGSDNKLNLEVYDEAEDRQRQFTARAVILTPGSDYRRLGVPGEEEFRSAGTGVSYCGTCDAPFFKEKTVVAVGGGNTAVEETLHLAKFAAKTYLVHRRDEFRATAVLTEELMQQAEKLNIELVLDSVIERIEGKDRVERAVGKNVKTDRSFTLECDGVFIFIGHVPNTKWLAGALDLTDQGFIKCDSAFLRTKIPGVFVAGDCRVAAAMQLATACGDGVNAAIMLKQYLADPAWWFRPADHTLDPAQWKAEGT
jgi:thioredoxin reductase (NADPH)